MDRPAGSGEIVPLDYSYSFGGALPGRVGPNQALFDREALASNKPFANAAPDRRLEQLAQKVAVTEAAVSVLREGRMIRHVAV